MEPCLQFLGIWLQCIVMQLSFYHLTRSACLSVCLSVCLVCLLIYLCVCNHQQHQSNVANLPVSNNDGNYNRSILCCGHLLFLHKLKRVISPIPPTLLSPSSLTGLHHTISILVDHGIHPLNLYEMI